MGLDKERDPAHPQRSEKVDYEKLCGGVLNPIGSEYRGSELFRFRCYQ